MSEKTRKIEVENNQNALCVVDSKPNKQKHNSKRRRCKKNKGCLEQEDCPKSNKVDEVVKHLCGAISTGESEMYSGNLSEKLPKDLSNSCFQNSKCNNGKFLPSSSTEDLNRLFVNLQVHASKNPIKSKNITDFLNIDLLKKTKCKSLSVEELERLKEGKLNKTANNEKTSIPTETLKEYFNIDMIRNSPGTSVLGQIDSSSMRLVSEIEQTFYSNSPNNQETSQANKYFKEYFNVDALKAEENNIMSSIKSTSKLLVNELEKTLLPNRNQESSKRPQKKKSKKKKANKQLDEKELSNWNERVFSNPEHQKYCFSKPTNTSKPVELSQPSKKEQFRLKSSLFKSDTKFPKHFTPEELQIYSDSGVLLQGIIRINQKNYKEAYITAPDKGMDILIEGLKDRNRALEGDEVYFVLKAKEHHRVSPDSSDVQRTAVIVGIKTFNHNRGAIGTLNVFKHKNNKFALFSPRDSRLPRIRIQKTNWPKGFSDNSDSYKNNLYFAKISGWDDLRYAEGVIVKEVGVAGDLEAETDAILLKYGLDVTPYSETLRQFIPPNTFQILEFEIQNREDFRKDCVFTIDPKSAIDLDDAVSCKLLPNGNYEIGVHISDVSYFLEEGTPLDRAVSKRATTIYLVQKTYHMLPFELCRLCSLTPGEDKLSFSVIWEITPDCKIKKHRFARSIINSCAQLSYEQVQAVIDNMSTKDAKLPNILGDHTTEDIKEIILFLHKIAVCLRNKRFKNGALRIDQKKIYFSLDKNQFPTDYQEEVHEPSHQLIEEFMLLANVTVAEKLNSSFPKLALLRSHPPPLPYVLKKLKMTLEKLGVLLDISSSGSLQASLLKYSGGDTESIARMLVLNNALAKPMARAKYYCGGLFSEQIDRNHYALNVPLYTHFTSPIRRYADVVVHRLLAASLRYCDPPKWTTDYIQSIASNCNELKYTAKMAQEMSTELYFALYIGIHGPVICEAVVCDIKDKSFDCIGLSTGIHQRLYFEHIKGELKQEKKDGISSLIIKWPKDESHNTESIQIIEMFSIVKIELKRISVLKIEANLLRHS